MTEALIDLPPIADVPDKADAPALPVDLKRVDLQDVALAQFGDWRADVAAAKKTLSTTVHDLSIQARIDEAKSLRHRLIGSPRAEARKVAVALKSKLAKVSKAVGAEEAAAVAAYDGLEPLITPQIEAAEQRIEDERLRKAKEEADRLQALRDTVDAKLAPWVARCNEEGMTAERVAAGLAALVELPMPPELADVKDHWAKQLVATRDAMERRRLALAQAEVEAAQAKIRAEAQRVAGIQARIAEIQAAATGHERASAADLAEARTVVAALDVSEAQYQEFSLLAQAAKAGTLAVLDNLHAEAVERETQAAQRASTPAVNVATAAATEGKAEDPEPGKLEAAPNETLGVTAQHAQEGVARNPLQPQPAVLRVDAGDVAAVSVAVDEAPGRADDSTAPGVTQEFTEGQAAQQVLKAEGVSPDATDRDAPADTSPRGGAMGAGQPAAAGPAGDDGPLETGEADARPYVEPAAAPAPAVDPRDEFVALVMGAFNCKFPSHPKPGPEWWARVRAAGQTLQAQA